MDHRALRFEVQGLIWDVGLGIGNQRNGATVQLRGHVEAGIVVQFLVAGLKALGSWTALRGVNTLCTRVVAIPSLHVI